MSSEMTFPPELLQRIINPAKHLQLAIKQEYSFPSTSSPTLDLSVYALPLPPPILSELVSAGLNPDVSSQLSAQYAQQVAKLRSTFQHEMTTTMQMWLRTNYGNDVDTELAAVHGNYSARYSAIIRRWHDATMDALRRSIRGHVPPRTEETRRSIFNQDALSILECAFDEDAYPTREMKMKIATQTGIEYKQVHVWFQNRRNRSKKQRKVLHGAKFFPKCKGPFIVFSSQCEVDNTPPSSPSSSEDEKHSLRSLIRTDPCEDIASRRPSHAFPTTYPPTCSYDPFPITTSSFDTPWPRRCTPQTKEATVTPAEVDELTHAFAKLTTTDPTDTHPPQPTRQRALCSPTCYSFAVTPLRAPLPALVRATITVTSSRDVEHRIVIVDSQTAPPRTPTRIKRSAFARDGTHPYCPSSRCSSSSSRTSSMGSVASLPSSPDSPLCTPPHQPVDLPHVKS